MPAEESCGAISSRLVAATPGAMSTETGVEAGLVAASKVSELILKFCSSVVLTAAAEPASHWKITSVPCPGIETAGVAPALSCDQLSAAPFQVVPVSPRQ